MFNRKKVRMLEALVASLEDDVIKSKHAFNQAVSELNNLRFQQKESKSITCNVNMKSPIIQRIIKAGRSALLMKAHPDRGGSLEEFEEVEAGYKLLKGLEAKEATKGRGDGYERSMRDAGANMAAQQQGFGMVFGGWYGHR